MEKTTKFIEKAKLVHDDRYDYSKVEYVKAKEKVIIICKIHGEFEQTPCGHLSGRNCSKCGGNLKSNTFDFIEKAKLVHGERYDYSKVEYINNSSKVIIICSTHGEFEQSAGSHLNRNGCSRCAGCGPNSNTLEFIEKAKLVHGERYDYSKVEYVKAIEKVIIICKIHGEFTQIPAGHLSGKNCSGCNGGTKSNTSDFIEKAKLIHNNRYDYSKVNYLGSNQKVIIICQIHSDFEQNPDSHLSGKGCIKCSGNLKSNTDNFIEKAKTIHDNRYDYSKVEYTTTHQKVIIICNKHGEFLQTPHSHTDGKAGCPKCSKNGGFSKAQVQWLEFLEKFYNIKIQHMGNSSQEFKIKSTRWKADGYCESTNTIYEYHGDFWHGNPNVYDPEFFNSVSKRKMKTLYANTLAREQKILELGYNLEIIWESDWKKINKSIKAIQCAFRSKH